MRFLHFLLISLTLGLAAGLAGCSGEKPVEKAIIGTWVQDTPVSMTSGGLQTTTSDAVLKLNKNGSVQLTRNLDIAGQGLPAEGSKINLELRGKWEFIDGQLIQTQETALIMALTSDDITRDLAEQLQTQADQSPPSIKDIITVDRTQLILQDTETGSTDIYRRK